MVDHKLIPLSQGKFAIVDPEDFEWLSQRRWYCNKGYAYTTNKIGDRRYENIAMHRLILEAPKGVDVDHANGNPLDNRRVNIRFCTQAQNNCNQRSAPKRQNKTSKFKGVCWNPRRQKWVAKLGNNIVAAFDSELEAAKAYDAAARFHYGEFAAPNFEGSEALSIQQIREAVKLKFKSEFTSRFLGVSWQKQRRKWIAVAHHQGKQHYLGLFDSELEAAIAYDAKIRELGLPLSRLNFPDQ